MEIDLKTDGLCVFGEDAFTNQGLMRVSRHEKNRVIGVLENRVVHISIRWKGELDFTLPISFINCRLKEVGRQHENKWRQRVALSDTKPAMELSA